MFLITFIYLKLQDRKDVAETTWNYIQVVLYNNPGLLALVLILMPLNWGLEAVKWRTLVRPLSGMSFMNAVKGVLTGLSLSFITPHGLGDYFGRVMQVNNPQRGRYIGAIMLGRFCQMVPTLLFGSVGLYYISVTALWIYVSSAVVLGGALLITYLVIRGRMISGIAPSEKLRVRINYYFGIIGMYSAREITAILLVSVLRYIVFAFQFGVILVLFLPEVSLHLNMAGVTWIFLSKSILPTFNFLSDLGVREFSAIYFFEKYHVDIVGVISASLTLWLINVLVPTITGAPLTLKMRLKTR
ncbi:flippase-like domain-containing protein [Fulvivirga ulvae]|uniref:lysylphosphatidylglycerol synthase domain-containing protein n=1 Tax=Fulvivirga ulvae TaxID=2904245 RepID=UPI001F267E3D|nr:lysylphosphatidylglycerol synthase domain-containing protein [Fulvivirga ulvae]UII30199.1 flippase-like domain-containing protein [Fulvivirga ulvae]